MQITPVNEIWGVGRQISKKLNDLSIYTVFDLVQTDYRFIRKYFSVVLERTVRELNGESCLSLDEVIPAKKQIVVSRSFGNKVSEYQYMLESVSAHAERAVEKLRHEKRFCKQVSVFLRTSPFAENAPYYANQAMVRLDVPTQDTRVVLHAAVGALNKIWRDSFLYHNAGVMLGDFYDSEVIQDDLFVEYKALPKSKELMSALDQINRTGKQVWFAGQGIKKSWEMKREKLSPCYTTRLDQLPVVNC